MDSEEARAEGLPEPGPGLTVVGIGASAGGLAALKSFFAQIPEDSGLAFVVVVHLSPDHESRLADILQPFVAIPVTQVTESVPLEPNRVYVIPPNANLNAVDTHLRLSDLEEHRRERAPIDHFFRTLSNTHDGHSIAIVLTGTGSDGALGVKAVKEKGGLSVVQDPADAEFDGMPQSAIATGVIDLVLPLEQIPAAILRYATTQPDIADGFDADRETDERHLLQSILSLVLARTGRDFGGYKQSTILRRIARRMQIANLEATPAYLELLRDDLQEAQALADDFLITVTSFFRDPEVFTELAERIVPRLFDEKSAEDEVRVWAVGCATGEEAYSLAILLLEQAAKRSAAQQPPPRIQVFASDLHVTSLQLAREGFYPGDIEVDVPPDYLQRYFHKEDGGYRVRKELRELIVFAPHNLLSDPPFSRLDLVTCRNVLIYLERDAQRHVMELFHYALVPEGTLVLGTSETVDDLGMFALADKRRCIWRKRPDAVQAPRPPAFPLVPWRAMRQAPSPSDRAGATGYRALHQRVLDEAWPSLLIGPDQKVVHLSDGAGRYLAPAGGEPSFDVFRMLRDELRAELRACIYEAREQNGPVSSRAVPVKFNGHPTPVVMHARPAAGRSGDGYLLVTFDEREPGWTAPTGTDDPEAAQSPALLAELETTRHRLQAIIEEHETAQEELQASFEELQSANEELRSTLEELETSKEELQSMNEELQTVNQENRHKVEELSQTSGDLQSLMASTDIGMLFLDRALRIMRFTPNVSSLFSIRPADRGRPLADLTHRLSYASLQEDAQAVLQHLAPVEREIEDAAGKWYLTRLRPYRSPDDRIEGVVLTFVDITSRKRAESDLMASEVQLKKALEVKNEFLGLVSHELRTPLTPLVALARTFRRGASEEDLREAADVLTISVERLQRMVENMLSLARLDHDDGLVLEPLHLGLLVRQVVGRHQDQYPERPLSFVDKTSQSVVDAQEGWIEQVVVNFLENAEKYAGAGSPVRVEVGEGDGEILVTVIDGGRGFTDDDAAHLFEAFYRGPATATATAGAGLGLAVCKRLIELGGGRVWARAADGGGAEFGFALPRTPDL